MTRSIFFILQCTEYGECARALLIEKDRSEIWMWRGMMEPNSFLSQTVTAISTPYCLRWHKSRPMVRGVGGVELWCGVTRDWCFMPFDQRFSSCWPDGIISEDTALILLYPATWSFAHLYFMTCLCSKVHCSLFTLLGLLRTLNFVCVWYVFYSVLTTVLEIIYQSSLNSSTFCSKIHFLPLVKSTASQFHKPVHLHFRPYWLHYIPLRLSSKNVTLSQYCVFMCCMDLRTKGVNYTIQH
jgi:hypothetical protein